MRKIERLRCEALESCKFRGHTMSRFTTYNRTLQGSRCLICDRQVTINSRPAPNEIDIGGEAVALDCED